MASTPNLTNPSPNKTTLPMWDPRDPPTYPTIFETPTFSQTLKSFRFSDYFTLAALSAVSYPIGWHFGLPKRAWAANIFLSIGATAGFLLGYEKSMGRLTGHLENDTEIKTWLPKH